MRLFLLLFLLAWVIGIGLGVFAVSVLWLVGVMVVLMLVGHMIIRTEAEVVMVALLVAGGFVWGSVAGTEELAPCPEGSALTGEVVDRIEVRPTQLRFVVQSDNDCRLLVTSGRFEQVQSGDVITISGGQRQTLAEVSEFSEGYAGHLARQGISGTWRFGEIAFGEREKGLSVLGVARDRLGGQVRRVFVEPDASVVVAMLMAERGMLQSSLVDQFRETGVSHILAISGLHISLLAGVLYGLVSLLPLRPWYRAVILLVLLWVYVVFLGVPASALRATSFWTVVLVALRLHALISLPTVLVLAASVLLTINPLLVADVGLQLSVGAVVGIFVTLFLAKLQLRRARWQKVWSLLLVSLGAALATGPLVAYHFGNVSLISVATNMLVVPAVIVLLPTALLALVASLIFWPLALALAYVVHWLIIWLDWVTRLLGNIPGVFWEEVTVQLWQVGVYYVLLALAAVFILRYQERSWREVWA